MGNSDFTVPTNLNLSMTPIHTQKKIFGPYFKESLEFPDNKKVRPRTDDSSYICFWDSQSDRSVFTFEPHGNGYIIRHQWHGWARNKGIGMEEFEGNSWIGINQDMPSDKRDESSTYIHLTKNKDEAIVVSVVGYRDSRMKTVELYS